MSKHLAVILGLIGGMLLVPTVGAQEYSPRIVTEEEVVREVVGAFLRQYPVRQYGQVIPLSRPPYEEAWRALSQQTYRAPRQVVPRYSVAPSAAVAPGPTAWQQIGGALQGGYSGLHNGYAAGSNLKTIFGKKKP